jgi:two-component system response regulator RegX3
MTKILVVEDEASFSDALAYLLGKEGFEVIVADTGPTAIEQFDRHGADLVLLDLMLPGLSGTEVCRQLRTRSNVPIIMLTAKDGEVDKVVGLELGADDYVTKPYSSRELIARVRAVLRRQGDEDSVVDGVLEAGPVRMDVERHKVSINGSDVAFPLKEFELLEFEVKLFFASFNFSFSLLSSSIALSFSDNSVIKSLIFVLDSLILLCNSSVALCCSCFIL